MPGWGAGGRAAIQAMRSEPDARLWHLSLGLEWSGCVSGLGSSEASFERASICRSLRAFRLASKISRFGGYGGTPVLMMTANAEYLSLNFWSI